MIPKKFPLSFLIVLVAALGLAFAFSGCGDSDGGGSTSGGDASAFDFTMDNMDDAAAGAVEAFEWVPGFGNTWLLIMQALGGAGAEAVVEVPLDLCANDGTATFALNDNDDNGIDVGDTFTLTITGCAFEADASEIVDATMTVTIVDITQQTLAAAAVTGLVADVDFDFTFTDTSSGDTYRIVADFTLTYNAPGELTLAGGEIRVEENGVAVYRLGCFTIFYLADPSAPETSDFSLGVDGVMNYGGKVMTVRTVTVTVTAQRELPMPVMYFKYDSEWDEHYPDNGALELLSGGKCAEAGVPSEVSATPDYSVLLEALPDDAVKLQSVASEESGGQDDIRLTLYNNSEEPPLKVGSIMTTWRELTGDTGGQGPGAFLITQETMDEAAAVFAETIDSVPGVGGIYANMVQKILYAGAGLSAEAILNLGPLGICTTGSAELSLNDPDVNDFDVGDTVDLAITDCDLDGAGTETLNGTISALITDINTEPLGFLNTVTADVSMDVVSTEQVDSSTNTYGLSGSFALTYKDDPSNPVLTFQGGTLTATENGLTYLRMGCFDIRLMVSLHGLFDMPFWIGVDAVVNYEDNVLTFTRSGSSIMLYFTPDYPDSGFVDVLSGGQCEDIGVDVVGEGFDMNLEALESDEDDIRLTLGSEPPVTIDTTWSTILSLF
jgi:hypothetical protein